MAHCVIVQSWTLSKCSAAVEYVVYPLGGILPIKRMNKLLVPAKYGYAS